MVGGIAVVLAVLGIFLPLLPTTPFLLLASACYMRSSERMHRWLLNNRLFGNYLRDIEEKKGMPRNAKIFTLILLWSSLAISIFTIGSLFLIVLLVAIGIASSVWILRFKTIDNVSGTNMKR